MDNNNFIAHVRTTDGAEQPLRDHLSGVAEICAQNAEKIGLRDIGYILGLFHDLGKYSYEFQQYIKSGTGIFDADDEEFIDSKSRKGKIDHSTAGAQYLWRYLQNIGASGQGELVGQILSLCIASHHSGLINIINEDGAPNFSQRMDKIDDKTHYEECLQEFNKSLLKGLSKKDIVKTLFYFINKIVCLPKTSEEQFSKIDAFTLGTLVRFLFSCLIDADRLNSAEFENPDRKDYRLHQEKWKNWDVAIDRFETKIAGLKSKNPIDPIRKKISNTCKLRAFDPQGIYTLTVPTGGGKTFSSLRYALHHAKHHNLDRIYYIIPYTSIIEQNANEIRKLLHLPEDEFNWVLEHHSNVEPEKQTWHSKLVSENWDAPIVFTTMVQFLETLFGSGTSNARRMHQLAKSVIIFDEIQTLPVNCTHLFCNTLNFFTQHAGSTVILCTATQPLLDKLKNVENGQLRMAGNSEIVSEQNDLFDSLKRVNVYDKTKIGGWSDMDVANLAMDNLLQKGNCLVIVNTKEWAQRLYQVCRNRVDHSNIFHLSTYQYPAHRKALLEKIKEKIVRHEPVLCISTQLIEAGVDIDFASVIRFLAGIDSIAQAAGRCNRNGNLVDKFGIFLSGDVHVINPDKENISVLKSIEIGQDKARRVFSEFSENHLLNPEVVSQFFQYYFYDRADEMIFPIKASERLRDDSLFNILGINSLNTSNYGKAQCRSGKLPLLRQSFKDAGKWFKAIDAPTQSVIVQHEKGVDIIAELCAVAKSFNSKRYYELLKESQQYSVNVFPTVWQKLLKNNAIYEVQQGEGIFYLRSEYYSKEFGLSTEQVNNSKFLNG